jgi:DNA-binding response OmpR family regulator
MELLREDVFQLVILDVMLPGMDGCTVCDRVRRDKMQTPVLMLTARDTVADRVRGLDSGADDYLVKPFDYAELVARVRALLRRDKVHRRTEICIADLTIDTVSRTVTRNGKLVALTPREYSVLEVLAREEGRTITREMLQNSVWAGEEVFPNTVDVCIGHLRRKMDRGYAARLVRTIHGVGYCLSPEPADGKEQI